MAGCDGPERLRITRAGRTCTRRRYDLSTTSETETVDELRHGLVDNPTVEPSVADALQTAPLTSWASVIVTNGTVPQQERKLHKTGLDKLVDGWVISEAVGVRKPDPLTFEFAARRAQQPVTDARVIGDSPDTTSSAPLTPDYPAFGGTMAAAGPQKSSHRPTQPTAAPKQSRRFWLVLDRVDHATPSTTATGILVSVGGTLPAGCGSRERSS